MKIKLLISQLQLLDRLDRLIRMSPLDVGKSVLYLYNHQQQVWIVASPTQNTYKITSDKKALRNLHENYV